MKYLFINSVYGVRSTGKLIAAKCHELQRQGHSCYAAYGREAVKDSDIPLIRIGTELDCIGHMIYSRIFDRHGFGSKHATKKFLNAIEKFHFDCIWIHNLHGYYINFEMLFSWIKRHPEIEIYWTLHDCWAFTGHCAYFTMAKCEKWKMGCEKCPQKNSYPRTIMFDNAKENYIRKKSAFTGVKNMTLITPSKWLADLTRESFLKNYAVKVVHNKIDKKIFKAAPNDFKKQYGIEEKKVVLGVAVGWEETKGYQDMLALRKILDETFAIILVGLTKHQIEELPLGMIGIEKTDNQCELAKLYTAADVFVNPTHQDNYPTVNLEAQACGTPVVTYDVGGSPESVRPENVVKENDIYGLASCIERICAAASEQKGTDNCMTGLRND